MTLSCWVPGFEVQLSQPSMSSSSSLRLPNPRLLNCTMAWSSCSQGATQGSRGVLEGLGRGRVGIPKAHAHGGLTPHPSPCRLLPGMS